MLINMGHHQPPTIIQVDKTTALGFANGIIKQKMSKAIDMRYNWVQYQTEQHQFYIYCNPGHGNIDNYHT